jgi:hypothetical protein
MPRPSKRPIAITLVGVLLFVSALLTAFIAAVEFATAGMPTDLRGALLNPDRSLTDSETQFVVGVIFLVIAILQLITVFAFWRQQRWAWAVLMTLTCISLASGLVRYISDDPDFATMFLDVVVVLALNQTQVQKLFGVKTTQNGSRNSTSLDSFDSP